MKIYTPAGDLALKTFTFPDGQPHIKVETHEIDFRSATVETAIRSSDELLQCVLVSEVLRRQGYSEINLDIRYLLGARMDRPIGENEPFTLDCVARILNSCGFSKVRILDAHSAVATNLIRNSENVLPTQALQFVVNTLGFRSSLVVPDKGAVPRVQGLAAKLVWRNDYTLVYGDKVRDPNTGALSGFKISNPWPLTHGEANALIVDDICDGGGTFTGLAVELRKAGAKKVYLYVTHGIFSKGLPLEGIDHIYTTDSYLTTKHGFDNYINGIGYADDLTIIPVSMKEMK